MNTAASMNRTIDNGGRRIGIDRRHFSYTDYIPSRRSIKNRRSNSEDRRSGIDRRNDATGHKKFAAEERRKIIKRRNGLKRKAVFPFAISNKKTA